MKIYSTEVSFAEVPDEISLLVNVAGCDLNCPGCHWNEIQDKKIFNFTIDDLMAEIDKNLPLITTVCFMGGEWHHRQLLSMLRATRERNLSTCLYTGKKSVTCDLKDNLDFLKTGKWIASRGGLDAETTNQVFMDLNKNEKLNYKFGDK